jgi:hypothetical protein
MGILLKSFRRPVTAVVGGKTRSSLETASAVTGGKLLRISEGRAEGSKVDGSEYVVAHVQVNPGTVIRVAGYGQEQIDQIRAVPEDGEFNAILSPMARGGYKLVEFDKPAPQPVA